jgi:hypothetical protein
MRDHQPDVRKLPRVVMLLAGLLYLLGTAAEPLVHVYGAAGAAVGTAVIADVEGDSRQSAPSAPHAEVDCLFCKAGATFVLDEPVGSLRVEIVRAADVFAPGIPSRASPLPSPVLPRAPPLA